MRPGDDAIGQGDAAAAREGVDLAAAHLAARAVQRRVVAICALSALIGVTLLVGAIVSAGPLADKFAGHKITVGDKR